MGVFCKMYVCPCLMTLSCLPLIASFGSATPLLSHHGLLTQCLTGLLCTQYICHYIGFFNNLHGSQSTSCNPFCLKVYPIAATKYQVVFIISTDLDNDYANYMQLLLRNSRIWEYNACVSCGVFSLPTVYELIEYLHCASCVFVHAIMCFFTW